MRNARIVAIVTIAAGLLAATTACTTQASSDEAACTGWAKAGNAWASAEVSPATSSAELASLRMKLRGQLQAAARSASGDVAKAMSAASSLPENALGIIEPGSTYRSTYDDAASRVQKACAAVGHAVSVQKAPELP